MTQNTIENKAAFTALHYGQKVIKSLNEPDRIFEIGPALMQDSEWFGASILELRALSDITDKESIEVAKMISSPDMYKYATSNGIKRKEGCIFCFGDDGDWVMVYNSSYKITLEIRGKQQSSNQYFPIQAIDYLRSRGFLLPYLDLSIEQILEYGWVKIKTS